MKKIEVDEKRLDIITSEASHICGSLSYAYFGYCCKPNCNKCPFNDSKSIKDWLKEGE